MPSGKVPEIYIKNTQSVHTINASIVNRRICSWKVDGGVTMYICIQVRFRTDFYDDENGVEDDNNDGFWGWWSLWSSDLSSTSSYDDDDDDNDGVWQWWSLSSSEPSSTSSTDLYLPTTLYSWTSSQETVIPNISVLFAQGRLTLLILAVVAFTHWNFTDTCRIW